MRSERLIDLASARLGGRAVAASDEFFAPKQRLIRPQAPVFDADRYTDRGKWMDGWETRRRRTPGHDWCIVALGAPGLVRAVDVDTSHFRGNQPEAASVDACRAPDDLPPEAWPPGGDAARDVDWTEILPRSPLRPDSSNLFPVGGDAGGAGDGRARDEGWTHLRLSIYPD